MHNKDLHYLKNLSETLNFEIVLSKTDEITVETIKTILNTIEKLLFFIGINVKGACDELFED